MIQTKQKNKIIILAALLICMSLFLFPMTAYADDTVTDDDIITDDTVQTAAPPTVEAEIIGTLLRIRVNPGLHDVETVYINDRPFNYREDSVLVIEISQYIVTGETLSVYAADSEGNTSNTVLLIPPSPVQPPITNNITPDGQGEVLDHLMNADMIEFITIETPAGNVFYLVIDHTRPNNNVYFLNPVTEWDLLTLAAEAELAMPSHIIPPVPPVVTDREPPPTNTATEKPAPESAAKTPSEDEGGSRAGLFIFLAIAGAGGFGIIYYLKIHKPKKEREMYGGGDDEEYDENDGFEDIDETEESEEIEEETDDDDEDSGDNDDDDSDNETDTE